MHGDCHPMAKLSSQTVAEIRQVYSGARGQLTELASRFGVHPTTVRRAATGLMWGHV
jgi:phage terminase small subunit